jgi:lysophospholipase L1-like esterase
MGRVKSVIAPVLICVTVLSAMISLNVVFYIRRSAGGKNGDSQNTEFTSFNNKVWVSYGDSITLLGGFQEIVCKGRGMTHRNCGVSGTTITGGIRNSSTHPAMSSPARLTGIQTLDPDIVTIFGGMNDMTYNSPIGTTDELPKSIDEKDQNTFIGGYSYIIENLRAWKPAVKILAIITYDRFKSDTNTEHQEALQAATRDVIQYYGLDYIDADAMFTPENSTQFILSDGIHLTGAGKAKLADEIISKFSAML